jgi:hypothetical protein
VAALPNAKEKRRWLVKNTSCSPWRDLPGLHTTAEIWRMRNELLFAAAIPADETPPKEVESDD